MVQLSLIIRVGYAMMFLTLFLMMWASMVRAMEEPPRNPCTINPLCLCSKTPPDLGSVECRNVPFSEIPQELNSSKVFSLKMENTGLRELDAYFLRPTGLYRLDLSHNPIHLIPDEAFVGLERSLSKIKLTDNELTEIPSTAMRHLRKLQHLDLSGNHIAEIRSDSWRGLEDSIQTIILADNVINLLPVDGFSSLPLLETLDLSGNNLKKVDRDVFRDGMTRLANLILADNLLSYIPFTEVSPLKALRQLDLSFNRITNLQAADIDPKNVKINLNILRLDYNQITAMPSKSFQYLDTVNVTYLDGNPISSISEGAFQKAKIRELYIRNCKLQFVSPEAFSGLEATLHVLDLSGNNISNLPDKLFSRFDNLKTLSLRENKIKNLNPVEMFVALQPSLHKLDISGRDMGFTRLQDLRRLRNLRALSVTNINAQNLAPEDFLEFGYELETLKLYKAGIRSIKNHAFREIRGIKQLDLSENRIETIELDAFKELGHSLLSLKISHGCSMDMIPPTVLKPLQSIEELDLTNNKLMQIPDSSFHALRNLRILEVHDNKVEKLQKGTFQAEFHHRLELVSFAFNNIRQISQHTFVDLRSLAKIRLEDNRIERIERKSFMNLDKLQVLNLRGNKINSISDEAFQNLPSLEYLDLAYNSLKEFDFDYLDQVGSLSILRVNASHNKIKELKDNATTSARDHGGAFYHCNVKWLDLSWNNISSIFTGYFRPAEMSLTHLYLSHNSMKRIFKDTLGNLHHLQWLDFSYNQIMDIDPEVFRNTKRLQAVKLEGNWITELPADLFRYSRSIRIVNLAGNQIRMLQENIFGGDGMEELDLSHNSMTKIPALALSNLAALTLCRLDLSHNQIANIQSIDLSNKFRSLSWLDLSHNQLIRLEDAAFATLPRLNYLDLSYNVDLEINPRAFIGLENTLLDLHLQNISLDFAPELPLIKLQCLNLAFNELPNIPQQFAENLTRLRELDISYNDLTIIPEMVKYLPKLRTLSLAGNPITMLTNSSLGGIALDLEELNIANLELTEIELGVFSHTLSYLRTLHMSAYPEIPNFNIPSVIEGSDNLRSLVLHGPYTKPAPLSNIGSTVSGVMEFIGSPTTAARFGVQAPASDFRRELDGDYPMKVRELKFIGASLNRIADNVLNGIHGPTVALVLQNTSITALPEQLFQDLHVRNITVDLDKDNPKLGKIPSPNSANYPNEPGETYLNELDVTGMELTCTCDLGWIEFWQRKTRQYVCSTQTWTDTTFKTVSKSLHTRHTYTDELCNEHNDELRAAKCGNKNREPLLEILKTDLECGWGSRASLTQTVTVLLVFGTTFLSLLL